jgi:hypothetical protein
LGKLGRRRRRKWGISFLVKTKRKILRKTGSNKKKKKKKIEKTRKDGKRRSFLGEARGERRKKKR